MRPTEQKLVSMLSQNGFRVTRQRRAVLRAVAATHAILTPTDIHERAREEDPAIGLVTVYRTLGILSDLGLICHVHREGKSQGYTLAPFGHHHHMLCSGCGAVQDFIGCDLSELEERLSRETGFEIQGHLLQFNGRCQLCQAQA